MTYMDALRSLFALALVAGCLLGARAADARKTYECSFIADPPLSGPACWVASPLINNPRLKEARFSEYGKEAAAGLAADATVQRGFGGDGKSADPRETSFYMLYRTDGWHLYIQSNEPDIINGKPADGALEIFISPGVADEPYYQLIITLSTGKVEEFAWQTTHRHYRPLGESLQVKSEHVPGGWGTTLFIPWEALYDTLPVNGEVWRFNIIRWMRSGGITWGGKVHRTGEWNFIKWRQPTADQRAAIQQHVLAKAWQQFQSTASAQTARWTQEQAIRDVEFFRTEFEPAMKGYLDHADAMENLNVLDNTALAVLFKDVPGLMEFEFAVDELRRDYLLNRMFSAKM